MVFEKVKKIITEQLGIDEKEVSLDSAFIEDLGADSLDIVELIMAMESEFDMEIEDDEVEDISTVEDVVNYIKEHSED
ncbi:MAG: acyl carrier protein [Clostridia bacterium]|nr:acyl carrier protein [Clostridia bacterium]